MIGTGRIAATLVAAATVLVLVGASLLPFLNPLWVRFEQDRTGVEALTGYSPAQLDTVASALMADLVLWQGDFRVAIDGRQVLNDREVSHMVDVRAVLWGGLALALVAGLLVAVALRRARSQASRAGLWRAVTAGARATTIGVIAIGAFAVLAFPVFFELFHRLFFSAGTYTFDPATERLVQLFPTEFWSDTTIAIGGVVLVLSLVVGWLASRRARTAATAEPGAAAPSGAWAAEVPNPTGPQGA